MVHRQAGAEEVPLGAGFTGVLRFGATKPAALVLVPEIVLFLPAGMIG